MSDTHNTKYLIKSLKKMLGVKRKQIELKQNKDGSFDLNVSKLLAQNVNKIGLDALPALENIQFEAHDYDQDDHLNYMWDFVSTDCDTHRLSLTHKRLKNAPCMICLRENLLNLLDAKNTINQIPLEQAKQLCKKHGLKSKQLTSPSLSKIRTLFTTHISTKIDAVVKQIEFAIQALFPTCDDLKIHFSEYLVSDYVSFNCSSDQPFIPSKVILPYSFFYIENSEEALSLYSFLSVHENSIVNLLPNKTPLENPTATPKQTSEIFEKENDEDSFTKVNTFPVGQETFAQDLTGKDDEISKCGKCFRCVVEPVLTAFNEAVEDKQEFITQNPIYQNSTLQDQRLYKQKLRPYLDRNNECQEALYEVLEKFEAIIPNPHPSQCSLTINSDTDTVTYTHESGIVINQFVPFKCSENLIAMNPESDLYWGDTDKHDAETTAIDDPHASHDASIDPFFANLPDSKNDQNIFKLDPIVKKEIELPPQLEKLADQVVDFVKPPLLSAFNLSTCPTHKNIYVLNHIAEAPCLMCIRDKIVSINKDRYGANKSTYQMMAVLYEKYGLPFKEKNPLKTPAIKSVLCRHLKGIIRDLIKQIKPIILSLFPSYTDLKAVFSENLLNDYIRLKFTHIDTKEQTFIHIPFNFFYLKNEVDAQHFLAFLLKHQQSFLDESILQSWTKNYHDGLNAELESEHALRVNLASLPHENAITPPKRNHKCFRCKVEPILDGLNDAILKHKQILDQTPFSLTDSIEQKRKIRAIRQPYTDKVNECNAKLYRGLSKFKSLIPNPHPKQCSLKINSKTDTVTYKQNTGEKIEQFIPHQCLADQPELCIGAEVVFNEPKDEVHVVETDHDFELGFPDIDVKTENKAIADDFTSVSKNTETKKHQPSSCGKCMNCELYPLFAKYRGVKKQLNKLPKLKSAKSKVSLNQRKLWNKKRQPFLNQLKVIESQIQAKLNQFTHVTPAPHPTHSAINLIAKPNSFSYTSVDKKRISLTLSRNCSTENG